MKSSLTQMSNAVQNSQICAQKQNKSDKPLSKYKYFYAMATSTVLVPLLNTTIPVTLMFGEKDPMVPAHQGHFIQELTSNVFKNIHVVIVKAGSHHLPYAPSMIDKFAEYVIQGGHTIPHHEITPDILKARALATCMHETRETYTFIGLPVPYLSDKSLEMMYNALRQVKHQCQIALEE